MIREKSEVEIISEEFNKLGYTFRTTEDLNRIVWVLPKPQLGSNFIIVIDKQSVLKYREYTGMRPVVTELEALPITFDEMKAINHLLKYMKKI